METLDKLRNIDYKNTTPEDFLNLIDDTLLVPLLFKVSKGCIIVRSRSGGFYKKRSQMTYCPVEKCKIRQRATLPGKTMFYGAISDDNNDAINIASSECSKLAKGGRNSFGREKITASLWKVTKPLNVISFVTDNTFPEVTNNKLLDFLRNSFIRNVENGNINDTDIYHFISSEFSKKVEEGKEYEYLISATLSTRIIEDLGFDGIIFPSVRMGGQCGLNIALSTKAVNNKLKFTRTIEQFYYKYYGKVISNIKIEAERGIITIPERSLTDKQIAKKLGIRNISSLPWI